MRAQMTARQIMASASLREGNIAIDIFTAPICVVRLGTRACAIDVRMPLHAGAASLALATKRVAQETQPARRRSES